MQVVYHKEQGVRAYALRALVRDPSSGHWNGRALLAVRGSALGEITTLVNDAMDFIVDEALLERMPIALGFFFENMQKLNDQALIQNDSIRHMHAYGRMLGADICNLYSLSDDGRRIPYMEDEEELLDAHINWDDNPRRASVLEGTKTRYRSLENHHPYEKYAYYWIRINEPPAFFQANKKLSDGETQHVLVSIRLWSYWRESFERSSIERRRLCVQISVRRMD